MDLSDISILGLMPPNLAADKNIKMMAEAFDEALRGIIEKIPDVAMIPNLALNKLVNETLIDLLAWQFHVDFYEPGLPVEIKRELVLKSLDWHYRKGTPSVVEEIVSAVFSRAKIEEWYEYGGRPYRFRIATEEQPPDAEAAKKLMRAINSVKNTRSFLDNITRLTDFTDEVTTEDRLLITILADFVEAVEAHDLFSLRLSDLNFVDHVYGRSAIVYGGIQGGARYNGVHQHNGMITFQREISKYKHDGEIVFGSGLSDRFASDEFSLGMALDFTDTVPSRDEVSMAVATDQSDRFPSSQIYDGTMTHNGQYKWNASHDVVAATQHREELLDSVSIGDEPVEAELLAALSDTEIITDRIDTITMETALEDSEDMNDALSLSVDTDIADAVAMDDSFVIGMIGYWVYGDADDSLFTHDGSIKFNYGELSYL
jgi:phage tail P2-like protein